LKRTSLKKLTYEWGFFKARTTLQTEHDKEGTVAVNGYNTAITVLYIVPKLAAILYDSLFDRIHRNISDEFYMDIRPLLHLSRAHGQAPLGYVRETLLAGTISVQIVQISPALAYGIFVVVLQLCLPFLLRSSSYNCTPKSLTQVMLLIFCCILQTSLHWFR